jgi:adenosylcobinamide-GDP ribazoletransferase
MGKKIDEYATRLSEEARDPGFLKKLTGGFAAVWVLVARIPLPSALFKDVTELPSADDMALLPAAGALLGLVAVLPAWLLALFAPPAACAWIACGIYIIAGWSLHLDGWGDLWDGIGSGKRGEAMRAVMKDSRIGSFGVAGIVLAIAVRASLFSGMDAGEWLSAAIVSSGVGRFAINITALTGEYPWDSGMGRDIVRGFKGYQLFCSLLVTFLLFPLDPLAWTAGIVLASLAGFAFAQWANKNLGGTNGDVLGASAVMAELIVLIFCAI